MKAMKALTIVILVFLVIPLMISQVKAQNVYLVEIELSKCIPDTYVSIVDMQGKIVMQYKAPTKIFKIRLPGGSYIFYAEIRSPYIEYVGYLRAKIISEQKIKIIFEDFENIPSKEIKVKLSEDVNFLRICTPAGYTLFETTNKALISINIPLIPMFIEVYRNNTRRVFFIEPSFEISSLDFSEKENELWIDLGETAYSPITGVTKASEVKFEKYNSITYRLDPFKISLWTTLVFLISLLVYLLSRKIIS